MLANSTFSVPKSTTLPFEPGCLVDGLPLRYQRLYWPLFSHPAALVALASDPCAISLMRACFFWQVPRLWNQICCLSRAYLSISMCSLAAWVCSGITIIFAGCIPHSSPQTLYWALTMIFIRISMSILFIVSLSMAKPISGVRQVASPSTDLGIDTISHVLRQLYRSKPAHLTANTKDIRTLMDVPNPIQNGMISRTHYIKLGTLSPLMVAANTLQSFYYAIAAQAHSSWLYTPETHEFTITKGQIQLSFTCDSADVPWDFVAAFGQMMAENVAQGWVDIYDSVWMNPARTIGIHVALRLKDALWKGPWQRTLHCRNSLTPNP